VNEPRLCGLEVAGDEDAWRAAGFGVSHGVVRIGSVDMTIGAGTAGIASWDLGAEGRPQAAWRPVHPNGATELAHLVVFTDDPARTTAEYEALGLHARRVREIGRGRTQTFFRAGEPIIELVGPIPDMHGEKFWGLAITVDDLDACAALLGDKLGRIKDAVQPGRRIATLRHEACGLTVPIAFMS
jgi:hypothetical protein